MDYPPQPVYKILFVSLGSTRVETFDSYEEAEFVISEIAEIHKDPKHLEIISNAGLNFFVMRLYKRQKCE